MLNIKSNNLLTVIVRYKELLHKAYAIIIITVPNTITFTYYHCTSIEYGVLLLSKYTILRMYYTVLHLNAIVSHTNIKGIHTLL